MTTELETDLAAGRRRLQKRLRAGTRESHAALEAALPIARPGAGLVEYRDHLRYLIGFHEPIEARLRGVRGLEHILPDMPRRWKSAALGRDLGRFAQGPRVPAGDLPELLTGPQAMGVVYVLEGAILGARTLLPKLRESGVIPGPVGSSYLDGYGCETTAMWARVCDALDEIDPGECDEVVRLAAATFDSLRDWRTRWETLI